MRGGVHYAVALPVTNDRIHREMPPRSGINWSRLELRAFGCSIRATAGLAANSKDGSISNGAADDATLNRMARVDDSALDAAAALASDGQAGCLATHAQHAADRSEAVQWTPDPDARADRP
jgi:hypothetical protein